MLAQVIRTLNVAVLLMWCGQFLSAQTLTVNKYQFNGGQVIPNLETVANIASQQIVTTTLGSPVLYVVTITNSGTAGSAFVTETPPGGFTLTGNITCTSFHMSCGTGNLDPSMGPLGSFNFPANANPPPQIVLQIRGYFTTPGLKTNEVKRNPNQNCAANPTPDCAIANLNVPGLKLGVDFELTKTASLNKTVLPNTVTYTITLKNNGPDDVYVGGIVKLTDQFTNLSSFPVKVTLTTPMCQTSATSVDCPDMPAPPGPFTLNAFNGTNIFIFRHDSSTTLHTNDAGHLPPGQSFTITFDALLETTATCFPGLGSERNQVFLEYSNNVATFSDQVSTNNSALVDVALDTSALPACPPAVGIGKKQITPTPVSGIPWGTPVEYEITVTNPGSTAAVDVPVTDSLFKTSSTPPFVATLTTGSLICNGCSFSSQSNSSPRTVAASFQLLSLFQVKIASIPANSSVTIGFKVVYDAPCETDAGPDQIFDQAQTGQASARVQTDMAELPVCQLKVTKTVQGSNQVVFNTPVVFNITYQNLSSQPLLVGNVRDVLSLSSSVYGDLPVKYTETCTVTAGTVTPPVPPVTTPLNVIVKFNNPPWAGITVINSPLTFGPNSTLACTVSVTATGPPDPALTCQGVGSPKMENSAFVELSQNFFPSSTQPAIFDSKTADLPLCRKVQVNKSAKDSSGGPGRTVVYTITVTNQGDDSVSGFKLTDLIDPSFTLASAPVCAPSTACTSLTTTGNPVMASFATLAPKQTVTITFSVTAPAAAGSYKNAVVGSFAPGGNFYFGGDPVQALQPVANIQVLGDTSSGVIQICKASATINPVGGIFTFTLTSGTFTSGPIMVPVGTCTGPIQVPPGTVTITEAAMPGVGVSSITASGFNPATQVTDNRLVTSDLPNRKATVTVIPGDASTTTIVTFTNFKVPTGFVEVCKAAAPGATVTGSFTFNIPGAPNNPYTIPVGACSGPIPVQAGSVTVTEAPRGGYRLVDVTTIPFDRLVSKNLAGGSAIATAVGGDLSTETVIIFVNDTGDGQMKLCKIAGEGITPGQTFTISSNGVPYSVPAGPPEEGGFCVLDSTFPVGTVVNVQETIPSGDQVSSITVNPPDRGNGKPDLVKGAAQVTIGTGFTEVTFTNTVATPLPSGQLTICKIAGSGVDVGTNFTFMATNQGSTQTYTVPAGPASQGGFCVRDGTYPIGATVTIKEVAAISTNITVTGITVAPAGRGGTPDLANRSVVVTIGAGVTEVAFTNAASVGVATTTLLAGQPGAAFSQTLAATGGTPPYFWQLMDGTLPPGFVLNPFTGEITGPPMDQPVPVSLTFKVIDSSWPPQTNTASFTGKSTGCCSTMRPSWGARP